MRDTLNDDLFVETWTVEGLPTDGEVTMEADGTFIDEDNVVILYGMGGVTADVKTWSRVDDKVIWTAAFDAAPDSQSRSVDAVISDFDCNTITFGSLLGFTFNK